VREVLSRALRSPFDVLDEIHQRMEGLMARLFGGDGTGWWTPGCEAYVSGDRFVVRLDVPGVDPKDLHVSVCGRRLTVSGERKQVPPVAEDQYWIRGISHGAFERQIVLPEGVDVARATASYAHGVLEVSLPLPAELQARSIPITVEQPAIAA
jgi:HSP20 family protein